MKIAVEGCAHGELDKIYEAIEYFEKQNSIKVDLLIICGDFQAVRNPADLQCMAVPLKYRKLNTFYKYYSGETKAPVLTIFIGGNHEASNYLSELPYGGWVCPNIYYLGYANVINIGGVRIAGLSGIYKGRDYLKGHFEYPPYDESSKKSVYHVRNIDVFRLKQVKKPIDVFISHDWPTGVYNFGEKEDLLKWKPFFRAEMDSNSLGSQPAEELLMKLKPSYWFAAHLHCKFAALVPHIVDGKKVFTKFLALDKCLPRRKFLQVIDVPSCADSYEIEYDMEWLSILNLTNHLLSVLKRNTYLPGPGCAERWDFSPSSDEIEMVRQLFGDNLKISNNFTVTAPCFDPARQTPESISLKTYTNPQTEKFCKILNLTDPLAAVLSLNGESAIKDLSSIDTINNAEVSDNSTDAVETSCTDLDISTNDDFFIDKTGAHSNLQSSVCSSFFEGFSAPEIKQSSIENDPTEVSSENPFKKFKRRNLSLYQLED